MDPYAAGESVQAGSLSMRSAVASATSVTLTFGHTVALDDVSLSIPSGCMVGLVGPDGVGKSSLLSLLSGSRAMQSGEIEVLGGDISDARHRGKICPRIAYMPQGLGKNLYPTLSVFENVDFFARLFGQDKKERGERISRLLKSTGLTPFAERPAGKLSGGMKQKLGLCCSLIHDPDLLILDEPTTGVDPLSRQQFWDLIAAILAERPSLSIIVATAYMEEAARFDWVVAMNAGRVIGTGTPSELMAKTGTSDFDEAFIKLLPKNVSQDHVALVIPPRILSGNEYYAIEAHHLSMRFGDFTAVDDVSFRIPQGEIFGFLGSNGCGKTTTMKMLTGLLPASDGEAIIFGRPVVGEDVAMRHRVGYMSQAFSLYSELTVRQNLELNGRLFGMSMKKVADRISELARRLGLDEVLDVLPNNLPLGIRQRMSLAAALIHSPDLLILDEPTSGVDPIARDAFWRILVDLSRNENVTIFISTHFMNEADRCDRISLMHAGKVLVTDTPASIVSENNSTNLEEAFIAILEEAARSESPEETEKEGGQQLASKDSPPVSGTPLEHGRRRVFDLHRMFSYTWRETLELQRDPIRATLAIIGSVILMFVIGYGINMDVDDLTFAVLDRDDTPISRDYVLDIAGSRYFVQQDPLSDYTQLNERMRDGKITLALEIPPGFGQKLARGDTVEIGAWVDGSMPQRAETIRSYVQGMHSQWVARKAAEAARADAGEAFSIETRFRYNPDVKSLVAIVPAVIPILLMLIPAMLAALSVVREKELGSIINLYVTPVTRLEFLLGKQIPYIALGMLNFFLLVAFAVLVFQVRFTGSFVAYTVAALLYVTIATSIGILMSTFMSSQVAAIFGTALLTLIPATQYSGMIDPVSSLRGAGAFLGRIYPTTHFMTISRGTFSKALDFGGLDDSFVPLLLAIPLLAALGVFLLRKQER